jgi:4-hydroxybenzoate adenylyltransferase
MIGRTMGSDLKADVVVVGGGIAGIWTAYKLAKLGVDTILITYTEVDRGGVQGATRQSVGAINTYPIDNQNFAAYIDTLGCKQTHPSVSATLQNYLKAEIEELSTIVELKPVNIGLALRSGSGKLFLEKMYDLYKSLGGRIVDGWVTRIVADEAHCRGLQFEKSGVIGKIHSKAIVLASGGYAGLYQNSIKTNCYGAILGRYMSAGGAATNLEFVFQHGYGNFDTNDLTPTEELSGAEIYNSTGNCHTVFRRTSF